MVLNAEDKAREKLFDQVQEAYTQEEIETAKQALRDWQQAHPEESGIADAFEILSHQEDYLRLPEASSSLLSSAERRKRERLIQQAFEARTLTEIDPAERELHEWARHHPEDFGIQEAFEGLSLLRNLAAEQARECAAKSEVVSSLPRVAA